MPPDLRVELGPLALKSPVICASGEWVADADGLRAAVDAGAAAVIAKSVNESEAAKRQLESAAYVRLDVDRAVIGGGPARPGETLLNRSGLAGTDFAEWSAILAEADTYARGRDSYVVASLIPADPDRLGGMARELEAAGLRWLELNVGAAHGEEAAPGAITVATHPGWVRELVDRVRDAVAVPLTVKLPGTGDVLGMAEAARQAGADVICLAGRPLGFLPDLETRRPLLGTFGAVGGSWALPLTLRWIAKARARLGPDVPLVATNGVRDGGDVARALLAGATAVELGTVVWTDGAAVLGRATEEFSSYLDEHGEAAQDIVGEAADAVLTYEEVADELDRHVR